MSATYARHRRITSGRFVTSGSSSTTMRPCPLQPLWSEHVTARVDHCNSLFYGTSKRNIDKLQRLQNALARAVTCTGASEHITPLLSKLHWLPITAQIHYKVALLTYKVMSTQQPAYLTALMRTNQPTQT